MFLWSCEIAKNADPDNYNYGGHGIEFEARSQFSLPDGNWGKKLSLFFKLTIVFLCMLTIITKLYYFWEKVLHKDWMLLK